MSGSHLAARLSLFNDGLLGNRSDYGTYKTDDSSGSDVLGRRSREEELDFQRELCRYVPNGGEVINDNPYNDFENAVKGLSERHITYLNKDYDQTVLKKWEKEKVTGTWATACLLRMLIWNIAERRDAYLWKSY